MGVEGKVRVWKAQIGVVDRVLANGERLGSNDRTLARSLHPAPNFNT
jgi:hypothetical protein